MRSQFLWPALATSLCLALATTAAQSSKPAITLDEFLSTTDITAARISPDGSAAVIATESPDWKNSIYRDDLWLWTAQAGLRPLTHSGSEQNPRWSPDGRWIAFVSDRALPGEAATDDGEPESSSAKAGRLWLIPVAGGEALPLFSEKLDVHAFSWSPDGAAIYFSTTEPLTHEQQDARREEWQDVIRWREQNRGDLLLKVTVAAAISR
jgi:dipeptidyl aminopeptidase/acylaminoacyl peptidase